MLLKDLVWSAVPEHDPEPTVQISQKLRRDGEPPGTYAQVTRSVGGRRDYHLHVYPHGRGMQAYHLHPKDHFEAACLVAEWEPITHPGKEQDK